MSRSAAPMHCTDKTPSPPGQGRGEQSHLCICMSEYSDLTAVHLNHPELRFDQSRRLFSFRSAVQMCFRSSDVHTYIVAMKLQRLWGAASSKQTATVCASRSITLHVVEANPEPGIRLVWQTEVHTSWLFIETHFVVGSKLKS